MKYVYVLFICLHSVISQNREPCGGTLSSDYSELRYPGYGSEALIPGEVCVWTIQSEVEKDIAINFSHFDFRSSSPLFDCSDVGIRIYSLANEKEISQNYTFCSDIPPPNVVIITGYAAVITVYSTSKVPSSGFTLLFSGYSADDTNKTHLATFSRNPSGLIGYPVGGSYPTSVVATWTIDSISSNGSAPYLDINLLSVYLESCSNSDPCSCDALILYEISDLGILSIIERHCASSDNSSLTTNVPGRFIIAFFSDAIKQPGNGDGFQLEYRAASNPPPPPEPNPYTPCGTIISDIQTELLFKNNEQHGPNTRCVWTFRVEDASNYRVEVFNYTVGNVRDGLSITGFGRETLDIIEELNVPSVGVYEVRGDIALLVFHTGPDATEFGFSAKLTALFYNDRTSLYSANYIFTNPNPFTLKYPSFGAYRPNEYSFFVHAPNSQGNTGVIRRADLFVDMSEAGCNVNLVIYLFSEPTGGNWVLDRTLCGSSQNYTVQSRDLILTRFYTTRFGSLGGFTISYT